MYAPSWLPEPIFYQQLYRLNFLLYLALFVLCLGDIHSGVILQNLSRNHVTNKGKTMTHVTVTQVALLDGAFYCATQSIGI